MDSDACPFVSESEAGESEQVGGIFIDISEQKSAEAEVALQRQEVEHLMRVSVLGELSGSIAHEINQPLTAILSNAQAALHLLGKNRRISTKFAMHSRRLFMKTIGPARLSTVSAAF